MGTNSKIEWCGATWNPVVGCTKISDGCRNCYAETMAKRLKAMGQAKYQAVVDKDGWTGKIEIDRNFESFDSPKKRKNPTLYFVTSMGDLFHDNVAVGYLYHVFDIIAACPQHIFQLLTKRPQNILKKLYKGQPRYFAKGDSLRNVWLGTTVESNNYRNRIDNLLNIPATAHFVSVEPMIGPVDLSEYLGGLDWVIIGGESGKDRRVIDYSHAQNLIDQCQAAGVSVFFKQWDFGRGLEKVPFVGRKNYMEFPENKPVTKKGNLWKMAYGSEFPR